MNDDMKQNNRIFTKIFNQNYIKCLMWLCLYIFCKVQYLPIKYTENYYTNKELRCLKETHHLLERTLTYLIKWICTS